MVFESRDTTTASFREMPTEPSPPASPRNWS